MIAKLIEGTNPEGLYLKAAVCIFEPHEWERKSIIGLEVGMHLGLLKQETWTNRDFWILDVSRPGIGGKFTMGDNPRDAKWAMDKLPVQY